uniref:Uncharacterized protein n=1 Tax=viral metagenome TaxID=1070528 RepID=A0A6M3IUX4_9ZZZZ
MFRKCGVNMKKYLWLLLLLIPVIVWSAPPSRSFTYTSGSIIDPDDVTTNEDNIFNYLARGVDTLADSSVTTSKILDGTIVNGDLSGTLALPDSKIAQITTASKVSGTSLTGLASIPSGAGKVPAANLNLTGGSFALPSGAVFFLATGSCPTGSTDVSATYANKFLRINATAGSTGGSDTYSLSIAEANLPSHSHAAGTLTGGAHTHTLSTDWGQGQPYGETPHDAWNRPNALETPTTLNSGSGGAVAVTGSTGAIGSGTAKSIDTVPAYATFKCCQVD